MLRGPKGSEYEGGIEVIVRTKTRGIKTVLKLLLTNVSIPVTSESVTNISHFQGRTRRFYLLR